MGARNLGGACLVASIYLMVSRQLRKRGVDDSKPRPRVVVTIAASIIVALIGIIMTYQLAASIGILGPSERDKYEQQSKGDLGIILGGRKEMLGYIPAIYDSPILGHGSWAKDPTYLIAQRQLLAQLGYADTGEITSDDIEEGLIPTHSCLFGAWVDAGILGALFWGWIFVLTLRVLIRVYPTTFVLLPIVSYVAFALLWDILFSPYGAKARIIEIYYVVMLMNCTEIAPHQMAKSAMHKVKNRINAKLLLGRLDDILRT
jgi:O-antigen ligase